MSDASRCLLLLLLVLPGLRSLASSFLPSSSLTIYSVSSSCHCKLLRLFPSAAAFSLLTIPPPRYTATALLLTHTLRSSLTLLFIELCFGSHSGAWYTQVSAATPRFSARSFNVLTGPLLQLSSWFSRHRL